MKVLILAGGYGTRLSEVTVVKPKPMVEIGGKPILWHIMKIYSHYGFNEFVVLLGYKGFMIKEYFANYFLHQADMTIDLKNNSTEIHQHTSEDWKVTLIDTGQDTMTGGRIKRAAPYIGNERFMCTYGDGVSNVDLKAVLDYHQQHGKLMTLTAIQPEGRYGALDMEEDNTVNRFLEKPKGDGAWVNGGFFVCEPEVLDYIEGDATIFERDPIENLAKNGELRAYKHSGFWHCMDTLRDKNRLDSMWNEGNPGWKVW